MIRMKRQWIFLLLLSVVIPASGIAQQQNFPLHRDLLTDGEKQFNKTSGNFHTAIKPFNTSQIIAASEKDSAFKLDAFTTLERYRSKDSSDKKIIFNPFPIVAAVATLGTKTFNETGAGVGFSLDLGKKLSLSGTAFWATAGVPDYIDTMVSATGVMPGMGAAYRSGSGYSYENYSGYLSYSPNKVFNFQAGKDKHFWGDGYRSLFISDAASNYPFFQVSATVWKIKYVSMLTAMKDVTAPSGLKKDFKNKFGTFHYLSWNATKRLNLSLFESIIWQGTDTNRTRSFDINYVNPVLFYRPVEYSLGSSDNAYLGLAFKLKVARKQQFYGQLILDEFLLKEVKAMNGWWANKQGFQVGFKSFDLFGIRGVTIQQEFNYVRPFTYTHGSVQQNYGHYNEAIAHPLGANFIENISLLSFKRKRLLVEGKFIFAVAGKNTALQNYGGNIFESYATRVQDYNNFTTQGAKIKLTIVDLRGAYLISKKMNLHGEIGVGTHYESPAFSSQPQVFLYAGLRTALWNSNRDF